MIDQSCEPRYGGLGGGLMDQMREAPGESGPAERARLQSARGLRAELDYLLPQGSAEMGPRVVEWFTAALERLAGEFVAALPAEGLPSAVLRDPAGGPFGAEGSAWCSLWLIGQHERRLSKSLRAWSPKNWERFLGQAADVSVEMSAKFSTLNRFGHAGEPSLSVSAYRPRRREARQWLRLDASYVVGSLDETSPIPDEVAGRWRDFIVSQALQSPLPVFGFVADDAFDAGATRTPLEVRTQRFPTQTLRITDSEVRGYSWITVVSPGIVDRLDGVETLRASGAFSDVTPLPAGGAVLQATPRLSLYEGDAVRRVFVALGPVLPDKAPWPDEFALFKLIYEAPRHRHST
ncbi:hypothetical protein AB0L64_37580 [Kribbella sp. NPDC051936]|uniref:hypothetical protein n=1 Tax=Kribbella sp. NPDC051936 TaxID=3154946 RepID=UPI00343ACA1A